MELTIDELLRYTDEERAKWELWFEGINEDLLTMPVAGEKETTIGRLIVHIFGAEMRYVERLRDEPLTDYRDRPAATVAEVFGFGIVTRQAMRNLITPLKPTDWIRDVEFLVAGYHIRATVRKLLGHTLIHEIRHWAQISRLVRERGFVPPGEHDLLFSKALD